MRFETTGNLKIVDVAWGSGIIEDDPPAIAATQLDGTGGDAVNGNVGATKLATVAVSGTDGELLVETPTGFGFVDKNGATLTLAAPVVIAQSAGMPCTSVSADAGHVCGVLGNGEIRCWGAAFTPPPRSRRVAIPARQVALGQNFACALDHQNMISCWGSIARRRRTASTCCSPPAPRTCAGCARISRSSAGAARSGIRREPGVPIRRSRAATTTPARSPSTAA